jgi:rhodanese-related sulfurtransferase
MRKPYSIARTALLIFVICGVPLKTRLAGAEAQETAPAKIKIIHPEVLRIPAKEVKHLLAKKPNSTVKVAHPEIPRIPAKELAQLLKNKADIVVVDTQAADGYEMWHIPSAVNISYVSTDDPTNRQLMLMALPMEKLIVIYCLCEEGTDSAKMAIELVLLGYNQEKIRVLEGGLVLWDEKGYPMIKKPIAD